MFGKIKTITILLSLFCFSLIKADGPVVVLTPENVATLPLPQVVKGLKKEGHELLTFTKKLETEVREYIKSKKDALEILECFLCRLLNEIKKETTTSEFKQYIILETFKGYLSLDDIDLIEKFASKKTSGKFICAWVDIIIQWAENFAEWCILNKKQKVTILIEETTSSGKQTKEPVLQFDIFDNLSKDANQTNENLQKLKNLIATVKEKWNKFKSEAFKYSSTPTNVKKANKKSVERLLEAMNASQLIIGPIALQMTQRFTGPGANDPSWISRLLNSTIISQFSLQRMKNGMDSTAVEILQEQFSDSELEEFITFFNSDFYKKLQRKNSRTGKLVIVDVAENFVAAMKKFIDRFEEIKFRS